MHGAGNRFLVLDVRHEGYDLSQLAQTLCPLYGADGLIGAGTSEIAHLRLHFYNRDGSRAALCGNGLRCLCRFAWDQGLAPDPVQVQTDAGLLAGWRLGADLCKVRLPDPRGWKPGPLSRVTVGVPHGILQLKALPSCQALEPAARRLRKLLDANVDFCRVDPDGSLQVLTYERGVEDFTAACGTGCAAAAFAHLQGRFGRVRIHTTGGTLQAELAPAGFFLAGPAQVEEVLYLEGHR